MKQRIPFGLFLIYFLGISLILLNLKNYIFY